MNHADQVRTFNKVHQALLNQPTLDAFDQETARHLVTIALQSLRQAYGLLRNTKPHLAADLERAGRTCGVVRGHLSEGLPYAPRADQ